MGFSRSTSSARAESRRERDSRRAFVLDNTGTEEISGEGAGRSSVPGCKLAFGATVGGRGRPSVGTSSTTCVTTTLGDTGLTLAVGVSWSIVVLTAPGTGGVSTGVPNQSPAFASAISLTKVSGLSAS